jgi:RNA recognition motif-containing protein
MAQTNQFHMPNTDEYLEINAMNAIMSAEHVLRESSSQLSLDSGSQKESDLRRSSIDTRTGSESDRSLTDDMKTTIMIRHIPCRYTKQDIFNEVSECGFKFDFLYLPHATRSPGNLGYAFVNFLSPHDAAVFLELFRGHQWILQPNSAKVADPIYAKLQGFSKNAAFYNNRKIPKSKYRPYVDHSCHVAEGFDEESF